MWGDIPNAGHRHEGNRQSDRARSEGPGRISVGSGEDESWVRFGWFAVVSGCFNKRNSVTAQNYKTTAVLLNSGVWSLIQAAKGQLFNMHIPEERTEKMPGGGSVLRIVGFMFTLTGVPPHRHTQPADICRPLCCVLCIPRCCCGAWYLSVQVRFRKALQCISLERKRPGRTPATQRTIRRGFCLLASSRSCCDVLDTDGGRPSAGATSAAAAGGNRCLAHQRSRQTPARGVQAVGRDGRTASSRKITPRRQNRQQTPVPSLSVCCSRKRRHLRSQ